MCSVVMMLAATAMIYFGRGLWDLIGGLWLGFMILGIVTRQLDARRHLPIFGGTASVIALALLLFGDRTLRSVGAVIMLLIILAMAFGEYWQIRQMQKARKVDRIP